MTIRPQVGITTTIYLLILEEQTASETKGPQLHRLVDLCWTE